MNGDGSAQARSAPATVLIPSLRKALDPRDATVLAPSDSGFSTYQRYAAANLRVARRPAARVVIRTREGVAAAVNWLRDNGVPFAVRGGGHCYEAFSQNDAVVLDMRGMADVKIEDGGNRVSVGGGALLGQIYAALVDIGRIVPAGSCPQVGAAGHVRLTNVIEVEMPIDASQNVIRRDMGALAPCHSVTALPLRALARSLFPRR